MLFILFPSPRLRGEARVRGHNIFLHAYSGEEFRVSVALFDLDNTLLGGDSDYLWGEYLVSIGVVSAVEHKRENDRFFRQYQRGELDTRAFLAFQLKPLADNPQAKLIRWREIFIREWIEPLVLHKARELLARHCRHKRRLAIVTSTNSFITRPIADLLEVEDLLATEPEFDGEGFTGRYVGEPCFAAGKVTWVQRWLAEQGLDLDDSWFYTDSHVDMPLLELVTHPVAVDPDEQLRRHARSQGWKVVSLR